MTGKQRVHMSMSIYNVLHIILEKPYVYFRSIVILFSV